MCKYSYIKTGQPHQNCVMYAMFLSIYPNFSALFSPFPFQFSVFSFYHDFYIFSFFLLHICKKCCTFVASIEVVGFSALAIGYSVLYAVGLCIYIWNARIYAQKYCRKSGIDDRQKV
jgi:hypothetical protein